MGLGLTLHAFANDTTVLLTDFDANFAAINSVTLDATNVTDSAKVAGLVPNAVPTAGAIPVLDGSGRYVVGSAGIIFNDSTVQTTAATGGGGGGNPTIPTMVVKNVAGTFTVQVAASITKWRVRVWGAGSGGVSNTHGGGAGGYAEGTYTVTPLANATVIVGAAGTGGGAGGLSSVAFGATVIISATGGASNGSGGSGSGQLSLNGGTGSTISPFFGGNSPMGGQGGFGSNATGLQPGGGGNGTSFHVGNGGAGLVIIEY